jgi:hypothetical protein
MDAFKTPYVLDCEYEPLQLHIFLLNYTIYLDGP